MIEIEFTNSSDMPKIQVIGIGGGGNNAVNRMISDNQFPVEYAAINTDAQVLNECLCPNCLQIGKKLTNGYGAGANPDVGAQSANESEEEIAELIKDSNMVILTCGMGGGTGTGAIPIIAKQCKEAGKLTVAVVTTPFSFESKPRIAAAEAGLAQLKENVDTLLVIPNDKLLKLSDKPLYLEDAFATADTVLKYAIDGITSIIFNKGIVNLDFNDLKTVLENSGIGHLGIGIVNQDGSIMDAVKSALNSPLLDTTIVGASHILLNSSGHINILELNEAIEYVREIAGDGVNIIWGTVPNNENEDNIVITIIATGLSDISTKDDVSISTMNKLGHSVPRHSSVQTNATPSHTNVSQNVSYSPDTEYTLRQPVLRQPKENEIVIPEFLQRRR